MRTKTIALPQLNNIQPTLESTAIKLMEEAGELAAAIAKFKGHGGVQIGTRDPKELANDCARELLDVAQTAITMMFVLEEQYGVNVEAVVTEHVQKLINKGYLGL
ncbi:MAG TPA: MazG-like family protein [Symbiobacteriaceae bacterium]|nr:MazG-like family protein [Symbiobacteriaceae bacterium]